MQAEQALSVAAPAPRPVRRIQPSKGFIPIDFAEIWRYRELLYHLLWRDIKARYKQTFLGPIWAILRPFATMVVMSFVFHGLAGFQSGTDIPYPLFLYAGVLIWGYFSSALTSSASSLLNNAGLMGKAYFPRFYAPLAAVTAPLVDFLIALSIVFLLFGYYHRWPSWHLVFLPVFIVIAMLTGLGIGLWLSGLTVRYRDVPFALPFVIQLAFYVTPVLYPVSKLPGWAHPIVAINPMTAVVDGFRWSLLGMKPPDLSVLGISSAIALVALVGGLVVFRRTERTIVDMF